MQFLDSLLDITALAADLSRGEAICVFCFPVAAAVLSERELRE
jgi:hypothetical protein